MAVKNKIHNLHQLGGVADRLRVEGKRIIQCHGVFDLLHPGHIRHFVAAKKKGDVLIVTINSDQHVNKGPGRPIFNEQLRAESVASLAVVDYVAINDAPNAVPVIKIIRPAVFIKGNEFASGNDLHGGIKAETAAVAVVGGTMEFTDDLTLSSTKLINNFLPPYPEAAQNFLHQFRKRYTFERISSYFEKIKQCKVLVIGEAIIDEYHYVRAMGKSPKDSIISTRYENEEMFTGGALACANHVAGYCQRVDLVTCLGKQDSRENFIREHLKPNIQPKFFYHPTAPTIVKRRFIDPPFLTKMFEVCYLDDSSIPAVVERQLLRYLRRVVPQYDLVIVVDYGHGLFTPALREYLSKNAMFLALNTQTNSANFGFHVVTKYRRADYVCVDHIEARLTIRQKDITDAIRWQNIIHTISRQLHAQKTVITLGHEGCLVYDRKKFYSIPVLSTRVLDRVGAGDAFLAITSPLVQADMPVEAVGFIGNAVGAMAVTIVGNRESVEPAPLLKSIDTMLKY